MWRNFRCLYICHVVKFEITQYVEKFQISPHLSYIEILNFSTRQIFLHISHMWEMWQISGMHLSNPPQPFYQSHVSFTPGLELFSSFLCSPIPCEESVTLWNCLIYIYLSYTSISFELTFNFVSTEHTGCISHWASPKTFKYGKPRLG